MLAAAAFSAAQIETLCDRVFGGVRMEDLEPFGADMSEQIVGYAQSYAMDRDLLAAILEGAAGRPAFQNYLLGITDMTSTAADSSNPSNGNINYMLLRLEGKMDQVLADLSRQQREAENMRREQEALRQEVAGINAKVLRYEMRPTPWSDRAVVALLAVAMAVLLLWTMFGSKL